MNQKIEWYKEVLALEPGSKVFFPLARMQAENGFTEDALGTLRHGLSRNPEHIEARLLLIDLLFGSSQYDALWPELDQIALMLGGYPGFWSAWNSRLSRNSSSKDAALALSFFSASLRGEAISWTDVIEHGLRRLLAGEESLPVASSPRVAPPELNELKNYLKDSPVAQDSTHSTRSARSAAAPAVVLGAMGDLPQAGVASGGLARTGPAELDLEPLFPDQLNPPERLGGQRAGQAAPGADIAPEQLFDEDADGGDADDDVFSLKTRSMAEVLAEQGDYSGALDIYNDLLRQSEGETERLELEEAIAALSAKAGESIAREAVHTDDGEEDSPAPSGQGKNRLLDVLDALARRLEARS